MLRRKRRSRIHEIATTFDLDDEELGLWIEDYHSSGIVEAGRCFSYFMTSPIDRQGAEVVQRFMSSLPDNTGASRSDGGRDLDDSDQQWLDLLDQQHS
jgi:hypothetical protein